jgi:signal transduction histidine kinase
MSEPTPIDFLHILAEGLKKPLVAAKSAAEELRMTATDPNSQRIGELVLSQMSHMDRMVEAMLDLSLLEQGRLQAVKTDVDLMQVLEAAVEDCRPALEAKSQRLVLQIPQYDLQVRGDRRRLVQIVRALLENAVKFTPDEGSIHLSIVLEDDRVQIRVEDTGCGVSPEHLSQVFTPFALAHVHKDGSLGISLSVTKRLVELHHGTISADSAGPGQGARFSLTLPVTPGTGGSETPAAGSDPASGRRT